MNLDQEMEKLAQLVALRAHRKMGLSPNLQLVGRESAPETRSEPRHEPRSEDLTNWTSVGEVDFSPRARKVHEIMHIANTHNWQIAVRHFLMTRGVGYLSDLSDPQLDDLLDRMHGYVDAAETGASLPDCLPAS